MTHKARTAGLLAVLLASSTAFAADITITNCVGNPNCVQVGSRTSIEKPNDKVILAGAIVPLAGTARIRVEAQAIEVTSAGSITAGSTGTAIDLRSQTTVDIRGPLTATNNNGDIAIEAVGAISVTGPLALEAGDLIDLECTGNGCTISTTDVTLESRRIFFEAEGDVILCRSEFNVPDPRGLIKLTSNEGSVRKPTQQPRGGFRSTVGMPTDPVTEALEFCVDCIANSPTPTPSPSTSPTPTATFTPLVTPTPTFTPLLTPTPTVTATPRPCENMFTGEDESTMFVTAEQNVDLAGDRLIIAENIEITAGTGMIDLTDAEVRNDFGKPGEIEIEAAGGAGVVKIGGATLVDDEKAGQDPDVSEINGREAVPHTGFFNVQGIPAVDD